MALSGFGKVGMGGVLCISGRKVVIPLAYGVLLAVLAVYEDLVLVVFVRSIRGVDALDEGVCVLLPQRRIPFVDSFPKSRILLAEVLMADCHAGQETMLL